jgi:hypothetical protein
MRSIIILAMFWPVLVVAQTSPTQPDPPLRRGAFFTESQGAQALEQAASTFHDRDTWLARAKLIRQGLIDGMRLADTPALPPLRPIMHSRRELDGYTVENVAFESLPGIYVTGNLYRPLGFVGKRPAILNTHGHSGTLDARFSESVQHRSATLARLGAVVFTIDMIGYADMTQCSHRTPWALKMQTINNRRAIDFLISLDDVDADRIGITGESGGGTQAFMLAAIDERVKVIVPVAMVSAHFFGGCPCESGMPVHVRPTHETTNAEIAALAAPRPMLLVSVGGDWTKHTPQVEFPFIQRIYTLLDARANIENVHLADEGHNYGENKRQAAYRFLSKHLGLDVARVEVDGRIDESRNTILPADDLRVFTEDHPRPDNAVVGDDAIAKLVR